VTPPIASTKVALFYKSIHPGEMDALIAVLITNLHAIMASMAWGTEFEFDFDVHPVFSLANGTYSAPNLMAVNAVSGYAGTWFPSTPPAPNPLRCECWITWHRLPASVTSVKIYHTGHQADLPAFGIPSASVLFAAGILFPVPDVFVENLATVPLLPDISGTPSGVYFESPIISDQGFFTLSNGNGSYQESYFYAT